MTFIMEYSIASIIGYLIGTFNLAYFIGKHKGINIKANGTKNAGASNATITMGWRIGAVVALADIAKPLIAITLTKQLFPHNPEIVYLTGIVVIIGHIYPYYLNFNGGKGFASYLGMVLAINWKIFIVILLLAIVITLVTDYITIATLTTIIVYPIYGYTRDSMNVWIALLYGILALIILSKHTKNLQRIFAGTEIGLHNVWKK